MEKKTLITTISISVPEDLNLGVINFASYTSCFELQQFKNVKIPSQRSSPLFFRPQIILKQLVDAAKDLEERHVFHRDIKVENILIETGSDVPRVRLIDFGLGCFVKKGSLYRVFYGKISSSCLYSSLIYLAVTLNRAFPHPYVFYMRAHFRHH